jgi:hypothetical protein
MRRRHVTLGTRILILSATLGVATVVVASSASGQVAVTIDSRTPTLAKEDQGWTASLGFTNLTASPIQLKTEPVANNPGCTLDLGKSQLPSAEHRSVTVTIPNGCDAESGLDFAISYSPAGTGGAESTGTFAISASPESSADEPNWSALWAFPIALAAAVIAAFIFFLLWRTPRRSSLGYPLKYLEATWSFKDSWVSNITIAAGLLTGIFGSSDVATAFLGEDADSSVALATVGAAFAVAFISAGPIIVLATKSKVGDHFTVGGVLAASAVTLAGAFGELYVVYESGAQLDLNGWEDRIVYLAVAAGLLLAFYALRALLGTLRQGVKRPPPKPQSDAIAAAKMIVEALKARPDTNTKELNDALAKLEDVYPSIGTSTGDDHYPYSKRSALL